MTGLRNILAWTLTGFLGLLFLYIGGAKLVGVRGMVQEFAEIGLGQWLRYVTGFFEATGAIGLFVPKYRFRAALQIAAVMIGATATNLAILHLPGLARLTAVFLILALGLAWLRRPVAGSAGAPAPN